MALTPTTRILVISTLLGTVLAGFLTGLSGAPAPRLALTPRERATLDRKLAREAAKLERFG